MSARVTRRAVLYGFWCVLLVACTKDENRGDTAKATLDAATGIAPQRVEVIDVGGLKQLVTQRNGKILFLNFWATWCQPCVEEFPEIVRLASEMPDTEIEFVAVSLDYPDEVESKILPFIREKKVPFKVLVADAKDQDTFINAVSPRWNGALPLTIIYDVEGQQRSFLVGQGSYEIFKKEILKTQRTS